jgi:hypothetical protein
MVRTYYRQHASNVCMLSSMLKRTNVYLDTKVLKDLEAIGKTLGGLKVAQVIRMALSEFVKARKEGAK